METFPPPYTRRNLQITSDFASNNSQQITLFAVLSKESEKSTSSEVLVADMNKLQIGDESFLPSSETASTSSSSGGDGKYQLQKAKLNSFLEECDIEPLGRRWMDWHHVNERTQERYIKCSSEIVKSLVSVIYPDNYAHLWKELKASHAMDKINETPDPDTRLLDSPHKEALKATFLFFNFRHGGLFLPQGRFC